MAKRPKHPAAFCIVEPGDQAFSGSMASHCGQWVGRYTCQTCGRKTRYMAQNFLAGVKLICTGDRFWLPYQQTRANLGDENFRSLVDHDNARMESATERREKMRPQFAIEQCAYWSREAERLYQDTHYYLLLKDPRQAAWLQARSRDAAKQAWAYRKIAIGAANSK